MKIFDSDPVCIFEDSVKPDLSFEIKARNENIWPVAGVDEVGRGPLAGPVVAAAVVLNLDDVPDGLDDSKRLSKKKREELFEKILETALGVSIASLPAAEIDRRNILQASLEAMRRAIFGLPCMPLLVLIDGRDTPFNLSCRSKALIKGDRRSCSIAAASIVAKVVRDGMMGCSPIWNETYGFNVNAGYGTKRHRDALVLHGSIQGMHRMSFSLSGSKKI